MEQAVLDWLSANGRAAVLLVPLFAFAEACVGIGLLVSGLFLVIVATTVHGSGLAPLWSIVLLAMTGAMAGDHVGFHIGRRAGPGFHHTTLANRYRVSLDRGEAVIRKYGAAAIFVGRFVPAIRSLIPALLGLSGFSPLRYLALDAMACALWALALGAIVLGLDLGFAAGQ